MPLLLLLLLLPLLVIALMPLILYQRYRAGSARRLARSWVATLNLALLTFSMLFFVTAAAVTNIWFPQSFVFAVAGLIAGIVVGVFGLAITRWESTPRSLHYTPNRWLILAITLLVSARVLFGIYRSIVLTESSFTGSITPLQAFGVPQSLAAGAVVLGYYLAYFAGLRWRIQSWQGRPLRVINPPSRR